jgi:hypothetical protein
MNEDAVKAEVVKLEQEQQKDLDELKEANQRELRKVEVKYGMYFRTLSLFPFLLSSSFIISPSQNVCLLLPRRKKRVQTRMDGTKMMMMKKAK